MQPQPQIIDSTSNETTLDSPNQKLMVTETYGSKSHSVPTMETSSKNQSQESTTTIPTLMTEPLLPQLVTPATPPTTLQDQTQLAIYQTRERPPEYNDWTSSKKAHWRKKFERNH
jgi:hypothetical protein